METKTAKDRGGILTSINECVDENAVAFHRVVDGAREAGKHHTPEGRAKDGAHVRKI